MLSKNKIVILTSRGGIYGQGHYKRMLLLNEYLNKSDFCESVLLCGDGCLNEKIDYDEIIRINPKLIIRDMRDSNIDEMRNLQKISKVLAVDDLGEGSILASFQIDLLPNVNEISEHYRPDMFLYGYNFYQELLKIKDKNIKKIEKKDRIFVYTGFDDSLTRDVIEKILPQNVEVLFAVNNEIFLRDKSKLNINYAEALMSSKILISHFGIMMYEADVCGCMKVAINPTKYHSSLCDKAPFKIFNMGVLGAVNLDEARQVVLELMKGEFSTGVRPCEVLSVVERSLGLFGEFSGVS